MESIEKREAAGRKGQVTIFIIIGIIAVIAVGMVIYLESKGIVEIGGAARPSIEEVPVQARPVYDYIQTCLEQVAVDGLRRIGDHGGYIDWKTIPGLEVNPASPTDSSAVAFYPDSDMVLPYWWYMSSANDCEKSSNCRFDSKRPPLYRNEGAMSIEAQLDDYIDANLVECLRGFEAFKPQKFEITELSKPRTKTSVTSNAVVFELEYPIEVSKGSLKYTMTDYFTEVPLNLKEIYELALNITNLQAELSIFEKYTQQLISLYGDIDKDALPPMAGFNIAFSGAVSWKKSEVAKKFGEIITATMPLLQVVGTKNFRPPYVPDEREWAPVLKALYTIHSMFTIGEEMHPGLEVTFNYFPQWTPYFDMNCNGEKCKPDASSFNLFGAFGIQRYNFLYDMSYPVFVDITNPYAFKEQGYSFKFFIESNMRNNVPVTSAAPPGVSRRSGEALLCKDIHRAADLKVHVFDAKSDELLDDVEISFKCGQDSCALGSTASGLVRDKLPQCIGGQLIASKEGYMSRWLPLDVMEGDNISREIRLEPYREIDVVGKRYLFKKVPGVGWNFYYDADNLRTAENMVITLKRNQNTGDGKLMAVAEVLGGRDPGEMSRNVRLVPGTYDVQVILLTRDTIYIPGENPMMFNKTNPFMEGGAHIASWTLTEEMLANAEAIQFNAYAYDLYSVVPESERSIDDTALPADIDANTLPYITYLTPRIVYRS